MGGRHKSEPLAEDGEVEVVRYAELAEVPWSNGLGVTREVARNDDGSGNAAFLWRISIARIDGDAPFSALPGVDRSLMALGKDGFTLVVGDADPRHLALHEIVRFKGEDDVRPVGITGPSLDLNLMTRRDKASGTMALCTVTREATLRVRQGDTAAAILLDGALTVEIGRHQQRLLQPFDAAIATGEHMLLRGTATIALIRVTEDGEVRPEEIATPADADPVRGTG